jgi:hypothetical protein
MPSTKIGVLCLRNGPFRQGGGRKYRAAPARLISVPGGIIHVALDGGDLPRQRGARLIRGEAAGKIAPLFQGLPQSILDQLAAVFFLARIPRMQSHRFDLVVGEKPAAKFGKPPVGGAQPWVDLQAGAILSDALVTAPREVQRLRVDATKMRVARVFADQLPGYRNRSLEITDRAKRIGVQGAVGYARGGLLDESSRVRQCARVLALNS